MEEEKKKAFGGSAVCANPQERAGPLLLPVAMTKSMCVFDASSSFEPEMGASRTRLAVERVREL